jgi:thiamine biosynthesis lipoprotein
MKKMFQALGTINSIEIQVMEESKESLEQCRNLLDEIKNQITEMDDLLSIYKTESEISRLNNLAGRSEMNISALTYDVLKLAQNLEVQTTHKFDISLQPIIELWGIGKKNQYIPREEDIQSLLEKRSEDYLILNDEKQTAYLKNPNQKIELGAIAKGYGADLAIQILKKNKIQNAMLNFGGTIYSIGNPTKIGIQNPFQSTGKWLGTLRLYNEAAVTSGYYEKYFMKDNRCYHHIFDPQTGKPSDNNLAGITVIGKNAASLDAISTAVYVLGIEEGSKLLQESNIEGIFILKSGEIFHTKGLENRFELNENNILEEHI